MREDKLAIVVLAHGGWSAAWAWKKVRPLMAAAGHHFFTPTYTGLGERAHLPIYLDAFVPTSGQALIDLVPSAERHRLLDSVKTGDGWRVTPNPTPPDPIRLQRI